MAVGGLMCLQPHVHASTAWRGIARRKNGGHEPQLATLQQHFGAVGLQRTAVRLSCPRESFSSSALSISNEFERCCMMKDLSMPKWVSPPPHGKRWCLEPLL